MASVYKRKTDISLGKLGKWTCCYVGADGRKKQKVGLTDRAESLRRAHAYEAEATAIREGRIDPSEKLRREASLRSVADHLADYQRDLLGRGDTPKHASEVEKAMARLLADASCSSVAEIIPERVRGALARMKGAGKSARTCNKYLAGLKSFATWLADNGRIAEVPRGLKGLRPYNEAEDRRVVRRALTKDELARLLEATENGETIEAGRCPRSQGFFRDSRRWLTGPERAALYRLAMGTGFRANELRTLTPESFHLDGNEPIIVLDPKIEKNRKGIEQPITRELAAGFRPFLEGKPPGKPVLEIPIKTAKMLRVDLSKADIPYRDTKGRVVDFHALRHSYISHLIAANVNLKIVQTLARHSSITLTLDRYAHIEDSDVRKALEGEGS